MLPLIKCVLNFQVVILVLVKFNSSGINFELSVKLVLDEPSEKNAIIKFVRKLRFFSYLQDHVKIWLLVLAVDCLHNVL